jgi:phosphate-selective porin OprO/OprP
VIRKNPENVFLPGVVILGSMISFDSGAGQSNVPVAETAAPWSHVESEIEEQKLDRSSADSQKITDPRIIVQENLQELPDLRIATEVEGPSDQAVDKIRNSVTEDAEDESLLETSATRERAFLKSDPVLAASRQSLTYIQKHVPFLTKRNIIFFGRLELDGANFSSGVLQSESDIDIRRFRMGVAGLVRFWPGWNFKFEVDLTDGENSLSDAYLSRRSRKWGTVRIGNQKVAQTLSGQTSSLSGIFMERPLPVLAFTLQRRIGLGWDTHLRRLGANVTVFAADPNEKIGSQGWAARAYFNPTRDHFQVVHIGASIMQLKSNADARTRARPESHTANTRLVDTGIRPGVSSISALGVELAGSRGPVTFKSEFYATKWSRPDAANNPRFTGWYTQASWFLTGEIAHYREGKFIRPNIHGENGAVEAAIRVSTVDLNDSNVRGGTEKNLTFALNWYSKTNWRLMGNLIKVKADDGPHGGQNFWITQLRVQYNF